MSFNRASFFSLLLWRFLATNPVASGTPTLSAELSIQEKGVLIGVKPSLSR